MQDNFKISDTEISGEIFSRLLKDAINTTTGFYIEQSEDYEEFTDNKEIVGSMVMCGEKNLLLLLSADEKSAKIIVSYMTGIDINKLSKEMVCDGITEIINMVAGGARMALEDKKFDFSMSVPFTIVGKGVDVIVKKRTGKFLSNFKNEDINLNFKIFEL